MLATIIRNTQNVFKIPELRRRILFTVLLLVVYRAGAHIPTPGLNNEALAEYLTQKGGAIMGFLDMFSGGALSRMTIFALNIMPYISASIIFQLLTVVIPTLGKLAKEGAHGRRKITQYTRYSTIGISIIQGFGISVGLENMNNGVFVQSPGWAFRLMTIITLTAGTAFLMWLGEQITERGIGNGISLIIFAGIVARFPLATFNTLKLVQTGELSVFIMIVVLVVIISVIVSIVYLESARRKISVQYARRVVGRKVFGGQSTHIPFKINTAGVIPPIFASSLIAFPVTITGFIENDFIRSIGTALSPGSIFYTVVYVSMIMFFCFFYTAVVLNPQEIAENMKKNGGFVPGIRPGQKTVEYLYKVLTRVTFVGAIYLAVICVIPEILMFKLNVPFYFGGTSLLIVIGVGMDTAQQVESHLLTRNYDGFMKKAKIRGRR